MEPIAFLNGQFVPLQDARVSIIDRGFCYGDGLFETMRACAGKVYRLDLHLKRLKSSAEALDIGLPVTRGELEFIIYRTLDRNSYPDATLRLMLSRGEGAPGLTVSGDRVPTLAVYVRPYQPSPPEWYARGVRVCLIPQSAPRFPGLAQQVKSANYLPHILARRWADDRNCQEAILLNEHGQLCEGTTTNLFLVRRGVLLTPPAGPQVLAGITRQVILEIAEHIGITCAQTMVGSQDFYNAEEAFLTNTGVGVLPVVEADGIVLGSGRPGPLTRTLRDAYLKGIEGQK